MFLNVGFGRGDALFRMFLALYVTVLIFAAWSVSIWEDEAYSLITSSKSFLNVIKSSYSFEGQPPFYFFLLFLWRKIDDSIFFARLLSVGLIVVSVYYFSRLLNLFFGRVLSRWCIVLFMLNPFTVVYALEVRLYALMICISCLSAYYFILFLFYERPKDLYLLLFLFLLGLYTQYFFLFFIVALSLVVLIVKGWRSLGKFLLYLIPVGLLFLPNLYFISDQIDLHVNYIGDRFRFYRFFNVLFGSQYLFTGLQVADIQPPWRSCVRVIAMLIFVYCYSRLYLSDSEQSRTILRRLNIVIIGVILMLVLFASSVEYLDVVFDPRYLASVYVPLMICLGMFDFLEKRVRVLVAVGISLYFSICLVDYYSLGYKTHNYTEVIRLLGRIDVNGEPWLISSQGLGAPFQVYLKGEGDLSKLREIVYDGVYYDPDVKDTSEIRRNISSVSTNTMSYLLITDSIVPFRGSMSVSVREMDEYLSKTYDVTLDTAISGRNDYDFIRVRRLKQRR